MHWQFHGGRQKTLYTRKVADVTKLTDFTDLQTYGFVRLSQPRGPPAHACGLQHEALRRGGSAASIRSHARTREKWQGGGLIVNRGGGLIVNRGGGPCETGCGGAAGRSCWGPGPSQLRGSSGVLPVGCGGAGLRSCWEAGPRARAHAESRIDFGTKSAYFWRQSGCTARIRKAWRWRGSAGSSTYSDAGLAVARERGITSL